MTISHQLVVMHLPKTGGKFATGALGELHLRSVDPFTNLDRVHRAAGTPFQLFPEYDS